MSDAVRPEISLEAITALPVWGRLYDPSLKGFGVRSTPKGASFFFRWRSRDGSRKHREISLGILGEITITKARRQADKYRGQLSLRIDPLDALREEEAAKAARAASRMTLASLAPIYTASVHKKDSSKRSDESLLRLHVLPMLGDIDVAEISRLHAQKLHDALSETPTRANRAFALLSHMMTIAAAKGYRPEPLPRKCLKKNAEPPRDRYLSPAEHTRLWAVLTAMGTTPHRDAAEALQLLIVTGARKNEIVGLKWAEVDDDDWVLRLADSKTGKRTIPLTLEAAIILDGRQKTSRYVFPNEKGDAPRAGIEVAWRIARDEAKLAGVRIHDLRHSFAAAAVHAGLTLTEIGKLLGHKAAATTARYAHVSDTVARSAAGRVGTRMTQIIEASVGLRAVK